MTALRHLPLALHGAFELLLGAIAVAAPFAFGFTPAGTILSALIGVLAIGLALDATQPRDVSAHRGFDCVLAFGAVLAALPLALAADGGAALLLSLFGLTQLGLIGATRYSARG